jgi:hypothetical protein
MRKMMLVCVLLSGCSYNPNWAREIATDPAFQTGMGLMQYQNRLDRDAAYINYMNQPTICQELPNGMVMCQ